MSCEGLVCCWPCWHRDLVLCWGISREGMKKGPKSILDEGALSRIPKEREAAGFVCKAPGYQGWEGMMMNEDARPVCFLCCEPQGASQLMHKTLIKHRNEVYSGSCLSRPSVCQRKLYQSWPLPNIYAFGGGGGL